MTYQHLLLASVDSQWLFTSNKRLFSIFRRQPLRQLGLPGIPLMDTFFEQRKNQSALLQAFTFLLNSTSQCLYVDYSGLSLEQIQEIICGLDFRHLLPCHLFPKLQRLQPCYKWCYGGARPPARRLRLRSHYRGAAPCSKTDFLAALKHQKLSCLIEVTFYYSRPLAGP